MSEQAIVVGQLRSFVERVERLEAEIRELNADKSDIYKEVRAFGYDVKTVRKIVAKRRKDPTERVEEDALFDLYWNALHGEAETGTPLATRACTTPANSPATANDLPAASGTDRELSVAGPKDALGRQSADTLRAERGRPGVGVTAGETAPNPVANVGEGANGAIAAATVDPASRDADGADRQQPATSGVTGEGDGRDVEAVGGAASVTTNPNTLAVLPSSVTADDASSSSRGVVHSPGPADVPPAGPGLSIQAESEAA